MKKFHVVVSRPEIWQSSLVGLLQKQGLIANNPKDACGILVFGGDGTILRAIRNHWKRELLFSGFCFGHLGFLTNEASEQTLQEIIAGLYQIVSVRLLKAQLFDSQGRELGEEMAFNDFYVKSTNITQTAKIRVTVDNRVRFDPLVCDGVLVCTQAGSTAYNLSASGEVLPIDFEGMVLTGICPHQQKYRWRSTILPKDAEVVFEAVGTEERPVVFVADNKILQGVVKARIRYSDSVIRLTFANSQDFRERVLRLKF